MMTKKTIWISLALGLALLFLDRLGVFKNPLLGIGVILLMLLGYPLYWYLKEYRRKKYPSEANLTKCPACGFEVPADEAQCHNCGKALEDEFTVIDEFAEDIKEKKICPYCGQKELETVYEVGRGYKEVCANCGKSRVSRKAIKLTLKLMAYLAVLALIYYILFSQFGMK
jgi:DNA-directed RNA polymerase subunit RPC12/RpoP